MPKKIRLTQENMGSFQFDFDEDVFNRSLEEARPQLEAWGIIPTLAQVEEMRKKSGLKAASYPRTLRPPPSPMASLPFLAPPMIWKNDE